MHESRDKILPTGISPPLLSQARTLQPVPPLWVHTHTLLHIQSASPVPVLQDTPRMYPTLPVPFQPLWFPPFIPCSRHPTSNSPSCFWVHSGHQVSFHRCLKSASSQDLSLLMGCSSNFSAGRTAKLIVCRGYLG